MELEQGLTSAQLFRALQPWSELLSRTAWIDFDAWQNSVVPPPLHVVTNEQEHEFDKEPPLDAVMVHPVLTLHKDGKAKTAPVTFDIRWQTSGRYASPRPNGFGGEDRFCSLSFADPATWAHLPLLIDPVCRVDDYALLGSVTSALQGAEVGRLQVEPSLFDTIILGFLDDISFHGTPSDAATIGDDLSAMVADIKSGKADVSKFTTLDELEAEMRAVARGDIAAPADAALPSAEKPVS